MLKVGLVKNAPIRMPQTRLCLNLWAKTSKTQTQICVLDFCLDFRCSLRNRRLTVGKGGLFPKLLFSQEEKVAQMEKPLAG